MSEKVYQPFKDSVPTGFIYTDLDQAKASLGDFTWEYADNSFYAMVNGQFDYDNVIDVLELV